jgi:SAM-dependent methyltransferase
MPQIEPCDFDEIIREETPQAVRIADWIALKHPQARILDVGCGPGIYVKAMREVGLEAFGVDNDPRLVEGPHLKRISVTGRRSFGLAGVVLSLEVGEHIPADGADAYVDFIRAADPKTVYFSAARPGQGGHGHINCQPKAYWVEKFHHAGFWLDPDATAEWIRFVQSGYHMGWLTQNGMVLRCG